MTPLGSESTVGGNGVNLPPWQADSQFPTAPPPETSFTQRLSDDDDTAPLPVLPRPSSSAAASAFRAAQLTCRSRPTPRGLVEFYSWWTVVERVGPVAIRSA